MINFLAQRTWKIVSKIIGGKSEIEDDVFLWPLQPLDTLDDTILSKPSDIASYNFLNVDKDKVFFKQGEITLSQDLIITAEFAVYLNGGTTINLINGASIISYSPITAAGSKEFTIKITSSDGSGGGLLLLDTNAESLFKYIDFNNLSNPSRLGWELTGAVTSYQSDISIDNCTFRNNLEGDDFLNIIRSDFEITNSIFSNIKADAFDSDFSAGEIKNSKFFEFQKFG